MSLQFVAGQSGAGKSYFVYKQLIKESLADPKGRFLIIVPEQFSMEAQRELVRLHPSHSLINIDILSFNRLAYRVFESLGVNSASILEDTGKILIIQKLLNDNKSKFKVISGMLGKNGTAAQLNSVLSELAQYRSDPDLIDTSQKGVSNLLKCKIEDIGLIRRLFKEYINGKYLTMEEVPQVCASVIENYDSLKGASVVFDGFTGFVPTQLCLIEKILLMCEKVTVTATVDKKAKLAAESSPLNLFHMTHQMTKSLIDAADRTKTEVLAPIWIEHGTKSRFKSNISLLFLENHLFRYENKTFGCAPDTIFLGEASDMRMEVEAASEIIARLVRENKYRYRDFAFVSGNIELYSSCAEEIFKRNNIPCFADRKQNIISNPAVGFVRYAIAMAAEDFSYKSVFGWLKSGFADFKNDEINLMENYVLAAGIKGYSKYQKIWDRKFKTITEEELEYVNKVREKFADSVSDFIKGFKIRSGDIKTRTTALYKFIVKNSVQEKCREMEKTFKKEGSLSKAGEYSQIYKLIMDFFQKLVSVLGDEKVSMDLYSQLIDAGFSDIRLGLVPLNQDQVLIGDIERTRLSGIKVMFFAGINEGIIPGTFEGANFLSEGDRRILSGMNIALAPGNEEKMQRQRLYLYMNLTKPSDMLYMSYSASDETSGALSPSYLAHDIIKLFPRLKVQNLSQRDKGLSLETVQGRSRLLSEGFSNLKTFDPEDEFLELSAWFAENEPKRLARLFRAVKSKRPDTDIGKKAAERLYGLNVPYSATRIEMFSQCAFRHFLNYALKLRKREVFDFTAADIGSILHEAVSLFGRYMAKISWKVLNDEERNKIADSAFNEAFGNNMTALLNPGKAFDILTLKNINRRTAWSICEQIKKGNFIPKGIEEPFILDGIVGRIDRLDVCRSEGTDYIRVIDYKSGKKDLDLNEFLYGTQIQLPLYMSAACEKLRLANKNINVEAAGIYYYSMSDPLIEVESLEDEIEPEKILRNLMLRGITRRETGILKMLDSSLDIGTSSNIIPVFVNKKPAKDGSYVLSSSTRAFPKEDFWLLDSYTRFLARKTRQQIEEGKAAINPKEIGNTDSCRYCEFREICGFDEKIPGYKKKAVIKADDQRILEMMADVLENERKNNGN